MKFIVDHDLHIHTKLSICSQNNEQSPARILQYAKEKGLNTICVTDHYWDKAVACNTKVNWWYEAQNFEHISQSLPLPQDEKVKFLFGCETDLDSSNVVGVPRERWNDFDFMIISTTHFHHMTGLRWDNADKHMLANNWVERFDAVLDMDLPFHKVGIAHLTCSLIANERDTFLETLKLIDSNELRRLFQKASKVGIGIELNAGDMNFSGQEREIILRPYRIAKSCGCKFYCGSDAHEPKDFQMLENCQRAVDLLQLEEKDKWKLRL